MPAGSQSVAERTVSHYRVLEQLGSGGMSVVFKAEDTELGRLVAIKFLPDSLAGDALAYERFRREARAASALNHPNICTIHEIGEHEGRPFIVMEYLQGHDLRDTIRGHSLETDQLLDLSLQITDGLNAAHTKGIVHRDIKPGNIFIVDGKYAKILDFGLAKTDRLSPITGGESTISEENLTSPGTALGTVAYMSPEQALGKDLDARTDLFSFGIVLYEMATGILPFRGDTSAAIFDSILHRTPAAPLRLNPGLPGELERIICTCLEKDRETRYQSAAEVHADLKRLKRETESSKVATAAAIPQTTRRHWRNIAAAVLGMALVIAIAIGFAWRAPQARVTKTTQITRDGLLKNSPFSDGRRVYFTEFSGTHYALAQVSAAGGDASPLPVQFPNVSLRDLARDGSSLLFAEVRAQLLNPGFGLCPCPTARLGGSERSLPAMRVGRLTLRSWFLAEAQISIWQKEMARIRIAF